MENLIYRDNGVIFFPKPDEVYVFMDSLSFTVIWIVVFFTMALLGSNVENAAKKFSKPFSTVISFSAYRRSSDHIFSMTEECFQISVGEGGGP